jgi:hypothetical protein
MDAQTFICIGIMMNGNHSIIDVNVFNGEWTKLVRLKQLGGIIMMNDETFLFSKLVVFSW